MKRSFSLATRSKISSSLAAALLVSLQACDADRRVAADAEVDAAEDQGDAHVADAESGEPDAGGDAPTDRNAAAAGAAATPSGRRITLRFKATFGETELACGKQYADQGSTKLRATPQDLRLFVERVTLIGADGREAQVRFEARAPFQSEQVALLDFTNGRGACLVGAAATNTTITGYVAEGDYTAIELVNGVPEASNHQNITTQKPPLQEPSTFWGWRSGYRFIMAELLPTAVPDEDAGTEGPGTASFVHIGSMGCAGSNVDGYTCSRPNRNRIRLDGFDPESSVIVADLQRVFADVDLSAPVECHGPDKRCAPMYAALGVDLETGVALDTQTVFRLEAR